jgi:hypothetical protein
VLERAGVPPNQQSRAAETDEPEQLVEAPVQDQSEPAPPKGRGGTPRKSRTLEARAARRVKGRTIYLNDDLFERLLVQSHRRGMTISDYVASILDRTVPDHRQIVRADVDRGEDVA